MKRLIMLCLVSLAITLFALAAQAQEQKAGQELVFPNVEQVQQRPSDVHIGSDPYYNPGMKKTDQEGYQKQQVETDKVYREETTTYKKVKPQPRSQPEPQPQPAPSSVDQDLAPTR